MYTNVPITNVKHTINGILSSSNIKEIVKEEILNILNVVLEQNYIQVNEQYYIQNEGLALGAPT
jgi:hypothetical protein